jgi:hypothetical protein
MRVRKLVSAVALSLAIVAGPSVAQENIDKVFGGITAEAGKEYGSLESVNGGITIRDGATVRNADTVNGGISIHAGAKVGTAETVNGGISLDADATADSLEAVNGGLSLDERAKVRYDIETVNGGIKLADGAGVGGDIETVNGAIHLTHAEVGGDLTTTNGDILVYRSSVVRGGILVKKPEKQWWAPGEEKIPRVVIGAGSVVHGALVFERDVELLVHATAKIGAVTGATAVPFTDELPPRAD